MAHAFVLSDDTVLCSKTAEGWWPLSIPLPQDNVSDISDVNNISDISNANASVAAPAYQVGHVSLHESLAINHGFDVQRDSSDTRTDAVAHAEPTASYSAPAIHAISYDYAVAHNIALPSIDESSAHVFVPYRQLMVQLPVALSDQISQAIQLLRWQADTQFCSRCASPAVPADLDERAMVCPVCKLRQYPRVQPCVITAITRPNPETGETQILLAHHHRYGQQKLPMMYGLIAGFVEVGESLEHAVVREVAEEVNISVTDIRYVSSQPWPYPSNLMLGFRATYLSGDIIIQEDELSHADFFDVSNLPKTPPKGSIAHDLIAQILGEQDSHNV